MPAHVSPSSTVVRRSALLALAGLAAAIPSGCGEARSPRAAAPARPAQVRLTDPGSPTGVYAIHATQPIPSGAIRFVLADPGRGERGAEVVGVAPGHGLRETFAAVMKAREGAPTPGWLRWAGGLGVVRPGQRASFTVTLRPGRYYVVDRSFKGDRATLAAAAASAVLYVKAHARSAPQPPASASITATEYRFRATGLEAGRHVVRLENTGRQPHNFVLSPLRRGKTLEDVAKYVADDSGPAPVDFGRETVSGVLERGMREDLALDLEPGRYALLCFASDRAGGPPHVARGMLQVLTVR